MLLELLSLEIAENCSWQVLLNWGIETGSLRVRCTGDSGDFSWRVVLNWGIETLG